MRMRFSLNGGIHAVPNILDESCQFTERAIFLDPNNRDAATAEVGHHHVLPGLVDRDEAGAGAAGGGGIQPPQLARRLVNGKGAYVRRMIERRSPREWVFADGVKQTMVWRNREERWVDPFSRKLGFADFASRGMEAAD